MGGCLPGSNLLARLALSALSALAFIGGGCSGRTIVAVDPFPCADASAPGCPAADLLNDLIGYWRLNDAPGSTTARDYSVWGNDGTLAGLDPATAWVAGGPEGGALSPQGIGYVNVPNSASIDSITTQVTIAAWVYLTAFPVAMNGMDTYATAISRQIGATVEQHYHLSVNDQKQAILFITTTMPNGKYVIGGPPTIPLQTWVHLAGTYDGSQLRLYVNGVQVASGAGTGRFAVETNPVVLSGNGNNDTRTVSEFVPGQLDEVMLYRRALGPDEIARLQSGALLPSGAFHPDAGP
jgi:large repetitive protein